MVAKYFRKDLSEVTPNNLGQLRVLYEHVLKAKNPDRFYTDALDMGDFSRFAIFNDMPVGAVVCKRDPEESQTSSKAAKKEAVNAKARIHIATMPILEPYRNLGLAEDMLDHVIATATEKKYAAVYVRLDKGNAEADVYKGKGFEDQGVVDGKHELQLAIGG
ncbi:N-alpha-acetyltransferase 50 [Irineochytrium annulatum]|nr:N-alpha-acetyltransferase 50 [Irineochytrium annulatum]